jgi:hypothetical protein
LKLRKWFNLLIKSFYASCFTNNVLIARDLKERHGYRILVRNSRGKRPLGKEEDGKHQDRCYGGRFSRQWILSGIFSAYRAGFGIGGFDFSGSATTELANQ